MTNAITLRLQVPDAMVQDKLWDFTDHDWWVDMIDLFFEDFSDRTGLWHDDPHLQPGRVEFELNCQGAYVFFKCGVSDWEKFLKIHGLAEKYPTVLSYYHHGRGHNLELWTERYGRGCGFYLEISDGYVSWEYNDGMDEAMQALADKWMQDEIKELEVFVKDLIENEFHSLLHDLEQEYDWLCSEEYVRDTLEANYDSADILNWAERNGEITPLTWLSNPANLTA